MSAESPPPSFSGHVVSHWFTGSTQQWCKASDWCLFAVCPSRIKTVFCCDAGRESAAIVLGAKSAVERRVVSHGFTGPAREWRLSRDCPTPTAARSDWCGQHWWGNWQRSGAYSDGHEYGSTAKPANDSRYVTFYSREQKCAENYDKFIFLTAIGILLISKHNSFRVLFDEIAFVFICLKNVMIF